MVVIKIIQQVVYFEINKVIYLKTNLSPIYLIIPYHLKIKLWLTIGLTEKILFKSS